MSDDLVSRLNARLGQSRIVTVSPGLYEDIRNAATALTEARAEIERLRAVEKAKAQEWFCDMLGEVGFVGIRDYAAMQARADAAESELSTLRARVREVVGPFAALEATGWTGSYLAEPGHDGSDVSVLHHAASNTTVTRGHFRAARQLNDDLK